MTSKEIGDIGEQKTCEFYLKKGYKLIKQKYRYKNIGEIDLIFTKVTDKGDNFIIFTEVKCRKLYSMCTPVEAVNISKQRKIIKTAQWFLLNNKKYYDCYIRFDIAEVIYEKENFTVNIIENAFP